MPALRPLLPGLLVALALTAAARAQPAPDRTGTGGGPSTTVTAPFTNREGVTKPPGSLGPGEVPSPAAQRREQQEMRRIEDSVCRGCR